MQTTNGESQTVSDKFDFAATKIAHSPLGRRLGIFFLTLLPDPKTSIVAKNRPLHLEIPRGLPQDHPGASTCNLGTKKHSISTMSEFSLGAAETGDSIPSSFAEFISVASGRSIISGADWGDERFELGLSGDGMIRVFWTRDGLHINYVSTTNPGETPPLMLQLVDGERRVPARLLEGRLRGLRSLYAIVHLISTGRADVLERALISAPNSDLEELLHPDEQLFIECLAPGSWYVTLWAKVRPAYQSVLQTVAIIYVRGREALLKKLEAEARLKELAVEAKEFELATKKIDYGLGLMDRLSSDPAKAALRQRVEQDLSSFLLASPGSSEVQSASHRLLQNSQE